MRASRYRERKKERIRCARIQMGQAAIRFLVEGSFLAANSRPNVDMDIERTLYALFNAAKNAGVSS
jgi:hypothetical protein